MTNKILFIENFKIFESWASKTYPFKCNEIKKTIALTFLRLALVILVITKCVITKQSYLVGMVFALINIIQQNVNFMENTSRQDKMKFKHITRVFNWSYLIYAIVKTYTTKTI